MSADKNKRTVRFKEGEVNDSSEYQEHDFLVPKTTKLPPNDGAAKKHTLDSDEEEVEQDDDDDDKLDEDDIEGQEEETIAFDGSVTITPFNMREEMESGHFDKMGTYIFDKEDEIKDSWMDDIDWVKVKQNAGEKSDKKSESSSDSEAEPIDELSIWKELVQILQPGESVAKGLRRLGGGKKMTSAQRLKAKKQGIKPTEEEIKNRETFQTLTGLADKLIQSGYMEIYEDTFEKISFKISQKASGGANSSRSIPKDEDDALDMFGEAFDDNVLNQEKSSKDTEEPDSKRQKLEEEPAAGAAADISSVTDEVQWEYKWKNSEDAEVHGPFTSSQMQCSVNENKFPDAVFVRRVGSGREFYTSRRIDFELYT